MFAEILSMFNKGKGTMRYQKDSRPCIVFRCQGICVMS
jgi:hypothetical protein